MLPHPNAPLLRPAADPVAPITPARFFLLMLLLLLCGVSAAQAQSADQPLDYAIVLRETQVFASLEIYAEILETVQPKQIFPVLRLVEDKYGIVWAMVQLDKDRVGYLTDIISVRKSRTELEGILSQVTPDEIDGWDQEMINTIQNARVEVGMSRTQLLFSAGLPIAERAIGSWTELSYPRSKVLVKDGQVAAITQVDRLPLDRSVRMDITSKDPEFSAIGGVWQDLPVQDAPYRSERSGNGSAVYSFSPAVAGAYRLSATWIVDDGNSPDVKYRILSRRNTVAEFHANQRLHNAQFVVLGTTGLPDSGPVTIEVSADDGHPFCIGTLRIELLNEPLPVLGGS